MAKRVETERPRRRRYYPWNDWTDGATWSAVEGEDFTCSVANFQTALHQRARLENMTVETGSPEPGIVEFRFTPKTGGTSDCCNGAITTAGDTTQYYVCRICNQPCNAKEVDDSSQA